MKQREIKGLIEKTATGGYRVLASTAATDRQGEIIAQDGWDLKNFMKNPVMLWAHDYSSLPVAKVTSFPNDLRGLVADYEFAPAEGNPMAQQIKTLVDGGFLNAVSVGFIPKERNGNTITKSELLEISFVPVPANQEALQMAAKSLTDIGVEESEAEKVVSKFLTLKEADKGAVADEVSAEENYEAKWAALDPFFDIIDAMLNVFLSDDTDPSAFPQLISEVITLLQPLAGTGEAAQIAALRERLIAKFTEGVGKGKLSVGRKIGAAHSAATKEAISGAIEHMTAASKQLGDLIGDESDDEEDGTNADDEDEAEEAAAIPAAEKEAEVVVETEKNGGANELRSLLVVRGMLGGEENKSRHALSAVNALIEARRVAAN